MTILQNNMRILNAISVDVEEYYHANNLLEVAPPRTWNSLPSRVDSSTYRVLDLFDLLEIKSTFFILGLVAHRHPALVKEIAKRGHEVASHGYAHRIAFKQNKHAFSRDIRVTKSLLEDLTGSPIKGYRAPSFSIKSENSWAYDSLIEAGYAYDSSLYPTWHPRYGNKSTRLSPFILKREIGEIVIIPLAVTALTMLGKRAHLPAAGGAYWRLLPRLYIEWALNRINKKEGRPFVCYFHPWEIDSQQPQFKELSGLTKLRHYGGIQAFEHRIKYLLQKFRFGPISKLEILQEMEIAHSVS